MNKSFFIACALLVTSTSFAKNQPFVVIIAKDGNTTNVLNALRSKGIKVNPHFSCPKSATLIKVTPVENSNKVLVSCLSPEKSRPKAISMNKHQNAYGNGNADELGMGNDPIGSDEFGAQGGDPNSALTEVEGGAQGGDPNSALTEVEGGAQGSHKQPNTSGLINVFGRAEKAAKSVQSHMYKFLVN